MIAASENPEFLTTGLSVEWERVELLGECLSKMRQGKELEGNLLERLRQTQEKVQLYRTESRAWKDATQIVLQDIEYDILACTVAPQAEPRIGWMFHNLQPGTPQPFPSPALIHDLLALDTHSANNMYAALAETATLRAYKFIHMEGNDPYQPIRPGKDIAARLLGRPDSLEMPPGATRIHTLANWDDLILPDTHIAMLHEFIWWIQHRETVVDHWGGGNCGGPVALFAGPSGTGKTFTASVLATELGWPLFRVDLGKLVSKYIGETEKNINYMMDAAHQKPMILQFDEADALFGKRGEVKEARDRYANMEVSHLLSRIESHQGPCILTSNMRKNLDPAFARRFQVVVDFPRPDATARSRLWQRLLPEKAPRRPEVDADFLGSAISLTGGAIRNVALHSAYIAAGNQEPISLKYIALAVWRELAKDGREVNITALGPLASYLN